MCFALSVFVLPPSAQAHMTVKGMNHFSSGLLHPLMTPAHVLVLLGLGLGIGQRVPLRIGLALRAFAPFSVIGLALTTTGWISGVPPAALAGIAFAAGGCVALEKQLPPLAHGALVAAGALAIGMDSGLETGGVAAQFMALLGTWLCLLVVLINIAHYVSLAAGTKKKWLHIGIRVAGSWIVAISLLVLAFAMRK
jgi:urease accessory protein